MIKQVWNYFFPTKIKKFQKNLNNDEIEIIQSFFEMKDIDTEDNSTDNKVKMLFIIAEAFGNKDPKGSIESILNYFKINVKSIDLNKINRAGETILSTVAGSKKFIKFLLDNGMNINLQSSIGETVLHKTLCAGVNRDDIIKFCLEKGANPDIRDNNGNTPINAAVGAATNASRNYSDQIQILLNSNADINIQNIEGKTPLDVANENNKARGDQQDLIDFLKNHNAKTSAEIKEEENRSTEKEIKSFVNLAIEKELEEVPNEDYAPEGGWEKLDKDLDSENIAESNGDGTNILFSKGKTEETISDKEFSEILNDFEVPSIENNHTKDTKSNNSVNGFVAKLSQKVYKGIFSSFYG